MYLRAVLYSWVILAQIIYCQTADFIGRGKEQLKIYCVGFLTETCQPNLVKLRHLINSATQWNCLFFLLCLTFNSSVEFAQKDGEAGEMKGQLKSTFLINSNKI